MIRDRNNVSLKNTCPFVFNLYREYFKASSNEQVFQYEVWCFVLTKSKSTSNILWKSV